MPRPLPALPPSRCHGIQELEALHRVVTKLAKGEATAMDALRMSHACFVTILSHTPIGVDLDRQLEHCLELRNAIYPYSRDSDMLLKCLWPNRAVPILVEGGRVDTAMLTCTLISNNHLLARSSIQMDRAISDALNLDLLVFHGTRCNGSDKEFVTAQCVVKYGLLLYHATYMLHPSLADNLALIRNGSWVLFNLLTVADDNLRDLETKRRGAFDIVFKLVCVEFPKLESFHQLPSYVAIAFNAFVRVWACAAREFSRCSPDTAWMESVGLARTTSLEDSALAHYAFAEKAANALNANMRMCLDQNKSIGGIIAAVFTLFGNLRDMLGSTFYKLIDPPSVATEDSDAPSSSSELGNKRSAEETDDARANKRSKLPVDESTGATSSSHASCAPPVCSGCGCEDGSDDDDGGDPNDSELLLCERDEAFVLQRGFLDPLHYPGICILCHKKACGEHYGKVCADCWKARDYSELSLKDASFLIEAISSTLDSYTRVRYRFDQRGSDEGPYYLDPTACLLCHMFVHSEKKSGQICSCCLNCFNARVYLKQAEQMAMCLHSWTYSTDDVYKPKLSEPSNKPDFVQFILSDQRFLSSAKETDSALVYLVEASQVPEMLEAIRGGKALPAVDRDKLTALAEAPSTRVKAIGSFSHASRRRIVASVWISDGCQPIAAAPKATHTGDYMQLILTMSKLEMSVYFIPIDQMSDFGRLLANLEQERNVACVFSKIDNATICERTLSRLVSLPGVITMSQATALQVPVYHTVSIGSTDLP